MRPVLAAMLMMILTSGAAEGEADVLDVRIDWRPTAPTALP